MFEQSIKSGKRNLADFLLSFSSITKLNTENDSMLCVYRLYLNITYKCIHFKIDALNSYKGVLFMTEQKIKSIPVLPEKISDNALVNYYSTPIYAEIVFSENHSENTFKKKSNHSQSSQDKTRGTSKTKSHKTIEDFKSSYKDLCRYIRGYFDGSISERHITLTYSYLMTDIKQLSTDFKSFFKKLERRYNDCLYVYIKEPQINGSWHLHCLIKRLDGKPFNISQDSVRNLWGNGYEVSVKKIYNIAGLCKYFDILSNEEKLKRLVFYPPNLRLFERSRRMQIKHQRLTYGEAKKLLQEGSLVYEKQHKIILSDSNNRKWVLNKTKYEQYKKN